MCGRWVCDHTSEERDQTDEERRRPLTPEEQDAFDSVIDSGYNPHKMAVARKYQHYRPPED
ncbi:MAG: hypothetical protein Q7R53_00065 [bacterium]|nr:hypothetical protein [bacterium]